MHDYYEILGVTEQFTDEEITARYEELREKYKEERWLDGAAGNEAAKMLTKIETAYKEIMSERKERSQNTDGVSTFEEVAQLLKADKIAEAQTKLDNFNERPAEWHYLQAVVYYKKNFSNDSKKQLEIAMQMDPDNKKYREAYGKLNARTEYESQNGQNTQNAQNGNQNPYGGAQGMHTDDPQMGGNACSNCLTCCYTYLCVDCLFSLCCGCR